MGNTNSVHTKKLHHGPLKKFSNYFEADLRKGVTNKMLMMVESGNRAYSNKLADK